MGEWSIPDYTQIMKVGWLVMHAACKKNMQDFHTNILNNNNNIIYYILIIIQQQQHQPYGLITLDTTLVSTEDDILKCITILYLTKKKILVQAKATVATTVHKIRACT
jgi:hypothetical protein